MKYKIGDKVKIKTWEDMEKEYNVNKKGDIYSSEGWLHFTPKRENNLNKKFPDRIITINKIVGKKYEIEEENKLWYWCDWMIEGLVEKPIPINTRWEILDL